MHHIKRVKAGAVSAAIALLATLGLAVAAGSTAYAMSGTTWDVSQSQAGTAGVTYSWVFSAGTTATVGSVQMTVPTGTDLSSAALGSVYGLGAGTLTTSGTTITYTVTAPVSVASGTGVYISVSGITNTATAGAYTSSVATFNTAGPPPAQIETGTSQSVTIATTSVSAQVVVPESTDVTITLPPTGVTSVVSPYAASTTSPIAVTLATNATHGLTLSEDATASLTDAAGATIGACPSTGVALGGLDGGCWGFVSPGSTDWDAASSVPASTPAGLTWQPTAAANTVVGSGTAPSIALASSTGYLDSGTVNLAFAAVTSDAAPPGDYTGSFELVATPSY